MNYEDGKMSIVKLAVDNPQLETLSDMILPPKGKRLINFNSIEEGEYKSPSRYIVNSNDVMTNNISEHILEMADNLFNKVFSDVPFLNQINDVFSNSSDIKYPIVLYLSSNEKNEIRQDEIYIYSLKKNLTVTHKMGLFKPKKAGSSGANLLKVEEIRDGFYLPEKGCICSFHRKINLMDTNEKNLKTVKVYNNNNFVDIFGIRKIKSKYAENTINRFNSRGNPLTLTQDNVNVRFKQDDNGKIDSSIYNEVLSDDDLSDTFAHFKGTRNNIIKKIGVKKLESVLDRLRKYANSDASADFSSINVPSLSEDGTTLDINSDELPVFAGLIENKVIEKLLDGKIEVPYFKKKRNSYL